MSSGFDHADQRVETSFGSSLRQPFAAVIGGLYAAVMQVLGWFIHPIERGLGFSRIGYFFILPNLLIFGIFILIPLGLNFYYAFTSGTNLFPVDRPFVGTQNFQTLFDCQSIFDPNTCQQDLFWRATFNTVKFVVLQVGGLVGLSLVTALALNRKIRARGFFRSVFFYPVLLSPVVVGLIWKWILQRDGVLNALLVNLGGERLPFLLDSNWATFWVVFVSIWATLGFYTLILLAGLQAIPRELYEAAEIDGAGAWQGFRFITLPQLLPTLFVVLVLSLIRAVQVFDHVYVLTGGGPGTATKYLVQYVLETGFGSTVKQFGLAGAASLLMAGGLMLLTLLQLRASRRAEAA